jgi:hypothetical protein
VLAAVNAFLASLSPVAEVRTLVTGRWEILVYAPHGDSGVAYTLGSANTGALAFFQLVVLSALLLATPVGVKERLRLLAGGIGLMFFFHVLCVAGCVYGIALIGNPRNFVAQSLPIVLGPFASGLAVVVWGLLTWRYWLAPIDLVAIRDPKGPSGRRYK